ncbi:putative integral membrane protein [Cryptosporidium felis]|nr:putative integral membrane protein [Cryptosporidium felis]
MQNKDIKMYIGDYYGIFLVNLIIIYLNKIVNSQYVTEIYQTCSEEEGENAKCGPGANCFIIGRQPTCHCAVDVATGISLSGNPYRGCTWDLSGNWQLYTGEESSRVQPILSPLTNEEFLFRFDRTDSVLATKYITGSIFTVNGITQAATGLFSRLFLDANDNTAVLLENAEGFVDQHGRTITLRTRWADTTLSKANQSWLFDKHDLSGDWLRPDGVKVHIMYITKPMNWPVKSTIYKWLRAYWFDDASLISPIRLCTTLFMDKTYKDEKHSMSTSARFVQLGFFGALRFGSNRIDIYSPSNGYQILSLRKVGINLPPYVPFSLGSIVIPESDSFRTNTNIQSNYYSGRENSGYYIDGFNYFYGGGNPIRGDYAINGEQVLLNGMGLDTDNNTAGGHFESGNKTVYTESYAGNVAYQSPSDPTGKNKSKNNYNEIENSNIRRKVHDYM